MLAAVGVGAWRDLPEAAAQWIRPGAISRPHKLLATYYAGRTAAYERILERLDGIGQL